MPDDAPGPDPVMARINLAIRGAPAAQDGRTAQAWETFERLWAEPGESGDLFHRCVLAHCPADVQEDPRAELEWDERALAAVDAASAADHSGRVRAFHPSLYLSLASDHLKLGDLGRAAEQLGRAERSLDTLPPDTSGSEARAAIAGLRRRLAA